MDPQTKLRLNKRHDFHGRILECSQAIRVEYQVSPVLQVPMPPDQQKFDLIV